MNLKINYSNFLDFERNQSIKTQNIISPKIIEKSEDIVFGHHSLFPDINIGRAIKIPIKASPITVPPPKKDEKEKKENEKEKKENEKKDDPNANPDVP